MRHPATLPKHNRKSPGSLLLVMLLCVLCLASMGLLGWMTTSPERIVLTTKTVPATITFDREVIQHTYDEEEKKTKTMTYYFTKDGNYSAIKMDKSDDDDVSLMVYTKEGVTMIMDDKNKTITLMRLAKTVGEGAQMSKEVAEKISKKPLPKEEVKDKTVLSPTSHTKSICGYPAYEYTLKTEEGTSSIWYAKVDFDPILIYTMGMGKQMGAAQTQKTQKLKNNPFAVAITNKNYLLAEMNGEKHKGMETVSISKKTFTINTAGYQIKDYSNMSIGEMIKARMKEKH